MKEDYAWFLENYNSLYKKYGNKYIVIKNKTVIGVYETYADGVRNAQEFEEIGTFIVQKCGEDELAYTNYISSMNFVDFYGER